MAPIVISLVMNVAVLAGAPPSVAVDTPGEGVRLNPTLVNLAPDTWVRIHVQKRTDSVSFQRQEHGGSCFDTKRGRIVLFGSNTHGKDWKNSPFFFDPVSLLWSRAYPEDGQETYAVNAAGIPVAGAKGEHPWAMHTFGALEYDPQRDEIVDCCGPMHMAPGKFTNAMAHLWPKIKRHPTWAYSLATQKWTPLPTEPVTFFPNCTTFDTDRNVVVGLLPGGVYELDGEPRKWTKVVEKGFFGYHTNAAYDAKNKAVVVFGSNENANDVAAYRPDAKTYELMPTRGTRPPKDQHAPMAFVPDIGKTVVLVDAAAAKTAAAQPTKTETWAYDLGADAWTQIKAATLPFACGMNYNMEYDPRHKVLLLVTGGYGSPTTVWAFRPTS